MEKLTDEELIAALEQRLKKKQQALDESESLLQQLKQLNRQLEAAEKMKTRFLSNIRNEINNPFGAILCLSENIMQLESTQFDKATYMASLIHREAFKLNFQLQNIFTVAEMEAGDVGLMLTQVDVPALANHVIATFEKSLLQKSLQIKLLDTRQEIQEAVTSPRRLFRTDASKLELILSNLLANAIEFSQAGEVLEVNWLIRDGILQIMVEDNGSGIEERNLESIFTRFKQLDTTPNRQHGGHGLGLTVVKALLDTLAGCIVVTSRPKSGSVFVITIPELPPTHEDEGFSDGTTLFFNGSDWHGDKL